MIFKIYNSVFGVKINGTKYEFDHVAEMSIDDPERNELTRGANASNKIGLAYRSGLKEPKRMTIPILNMSIALKAALDSAYDNQTRLECFCIDKSDGSSKTMRNALLSNKPQQLMLDDSPESMNVSLEFVSFDSVEVHKS